MNIVREYVEDTISEWLDPPTDREKLRKLKRRLARHMADVQKKEAAAAAREGALRAQLFKIADAGDEAKLREAAFDAAGAVALRKSLQKSRRVIASADARLVAAESSGFVREALAVASDALGIASGAAGFAGAQRQVQEFQRQMMLADVLEDGMQDLADPAEDEADTEDLVQQLLADARLRVTLSMPAASTGARADAERAVVSKGAPTV